MLVIKAGRYRTQEQNRSDALQRLHALIKRATAPQKVRQPTAPTASARRKRLDNKTRRGQVKSLRGRVEEE